MEWRRVQLLRPSCSTSGGQSEGREGVDCAAAEGGVDVDGDALTVFLVWEAQSAKEVQERQLE
jgi:hypothetical protein